MTTQLSVVFVVVACATASGFPACSGRNIRQPVCGDRRCDGAETGDSCPDDCGCGNNVLNPGEACDGEDLGHATCNSEGFEGGDLACRENCLFAYAGCYLCGNGVLERYEACDASDLGGSQCADLGFDGGGLRCTADCDHDVEHCCTNICQPTGTSRCDNSVVQTCAMHANGCLSWDDTTDCADTGQVCEGSGSQAQCVPSCGSHCSSIGSVACSGTNVVVCQEVQVGCFDWVTQQDCSANGQECIFAAGTGQCGQNGTGESCSDQYSITTLPFTLNGNDFTADFSDDHDFSDATDCDAAFGAEAVFALWLARGTTIALSETGNMNAVMRILDTCDPTGARCLVGLDDIFGVTEIRFTAPADGVYHVILEAYHLVPLDKGYDFSVIVVPSETDCGNGVDDNGDGLVDCEDPACFGNSVHCTAETLCQDGWDNDDDGQTDCDDSECAVIPICSTKKGYWERFASGNPNDLLGCTLTFVRDVNEPNGYARYFSCTGLIDFPVTPGSGTTDSTTLTLDDSDSCEYTPSAINLEFYGISYATFFVGSNGFITFGNGDNFSHTLPTSFFLQPRVAGLDLNFDPGNGGTIIVDEFVDHIAVTFDGVPRRITGETCSFQIVLYATNTIEFHYLQISVLDQGIVGLSNGGALGNPPPEVNFVP